jgi:hypothetical protein
MHLNIIKAIYDKTIVNIILQRKTGPISANIRIEIRVSKEVKDLVNVNDKPLQKELEEDI